MLIYYCVLSYLRFHSIRLRSISLSSPEVSYHESRTNPISRTDLETLVLQQYRHGKFSDLVTKVEATVIGN
ncbi:hypothetical protein NE237_002043 [Protea cynaroides]|uniref:Uncharacterized protein n=1 Tax=Protea cynaroides TaxID=273540 RepID=A0A9Q0KUI0_9MAGN|nr:hypothetical protein NE237_002043 [Protea cynaroides]